MPRRIDRDARKAQLAEAVWRVIVERGIGAVSVRAVADQAGVAVGSLRHVFPTRAELLAFSAELMVRRAKARIAALPRTGELRADAVEILKQLLPLQPDSRAELEVNLALVAESPALPELAAIRDQAHRELAEGCVRIVQPLAGRPRDAALERDARRLHALVDGLALHLLTEPASHDPQWALDLLAEEVDRLAGGHAL